MTRILVGFIFLAVTGCASNPSLSDLSATQRQKYDKMVVNGETKEISLQVVVGEVKGISCRRNAYTGKIPSESEAIDALKINAALLNADTVLNTACQTKGTDWVNNCWSSIVCVGYAVRTTR